MMSSNANLDSTQQNTDGNWVVHIWHTLSAAEADLENLRVVCICVVPESLRCSKREAFIPQFVGLGPYHHFRADLIMTQKKKLAAAKRVLKDLLPSDMNQFQQQISNIGSEVQTLYHPDVKSTYNDHTLSFLFTVDGLFLLAFITSSGESDAEFSNFLTGNLRMLLFNAAGVELTKNVLIREVFMLENQIPFHVLEQISGKKIIQSESNGHEGLGSNVVNFCKQHCPVLVKLEVLPDNTVHLLDLMYHLIVPRPQSPPQPHEPEEAQQNPVPEPQPATEPNHEPQPEPMFVNFFENIGREFYGSWHSQILTIPAAFIFVIPPLIVADLVYLIVLKPFLPEPEPEPQAAEPEHESQSSESESEPESQQEPEPEPESQPEPEPQPETDEFQFGSWESLGYLIVGELIFLPAYFIYLILKLFWSVISSIIRTIKRVLSYLFGLVKRAFRRSSFNSAFGWLHDALSNMEGRVNNPLLKPLTEAVAHLKVMTEERQTRDSDEGAPLADQRIPSAMQLHNAGIFFKPAESGISSIDFDDENCVFYLPSIRLDVNSEVIIRNLLAYETLIKSNHPLVFTRYVGFLRAIIDTPADVKILVDSEIIKTELWSEKVAELFKGMSKSIRPTMTPDLDKVIHKVKAKFDTTQKRINWDVIKHMSGTFFTILGCLLFLFFTGLQTYCSVVNCSGTSKHVKLPKDGESYGRNNYFISSM